MSLQPGPWEPTAPTVLLLLMIAGHVLADFLIQSRDHVEAKRRGVGFLTHGLAVLVTHLVVLAPVLSGPIAAVMVGVSAIHVAIDWGKSRWISSSRGRIRPFALDQAAHLLVLVVGWAAFIHAFGGVVEFRWPFAGHVNLYLGGALLASAFAFNATGGSVIVEGVLNLLPVEDTGGEDPAGYEGAGRLIGILERTLMLALILYGQWAAIALLITAKSIARFEEIKVRKFAEYYLVGTLASLLVALVVGFVVAETILPILR